jgi:anhydro-N-acetylmuramic acid kinase
MNKNIQHLYNIASKDERIIIGLMSGTSLDGLDIALCKCTGSGTATTIDVLQFETVPYNNEFKQQVKSIFSKKTVDLEKLCLLNEWIALQHASMINDCLQKWNIKKEDVDAIASHGQTIYHAPKSLHQQAMFGNATLQIGDADHLAVHTGIITISDFRQKHIAAGGEGAPLAVYGDYLLFSQKEENRIMLNIGGIANFTFLPGNLDASEMFSTDVGPGNTIMDAYMQQHFPWKHFDEDAAIASQGKVNEILLAALKDQDFFAQGFPKTTGPELFNLAYLDNAIIKSSMASPSHEDTMATLNRFTADTIVDALQRTMKQNSFTVYASGGGMHNPLLMRNIHEQLSNATFKDITDLNVNPDAKEAVLFALLANETLCGGNTHFGNGLPNVSMGKISFPW